MATYKRWLGAVATYKYNPSSEELLSGKLDYAILVRDQYFFVAWSKTKEGPARPDSAAAAEDLGDMLVDANGHRIRLTTTYKEEI